MSTPSLESRVKLVAVSATLSFTATSSLFCYVLVLVVLSRIRLRWLLPDPLAEPEKYLTRSHRFNEFQTWAHKKMAFIHTPFGIMFMNMVFADFIQSLGFGLNYVWVANAHKNCTSKACIRICTFQGVLIQLGDVASAFSNLLIAIQTYVILVSTWHLPLWSAWASVPCVWITAMILGLVAPSINEHWESSAPFYTWAGAWCWINAEYSPFRLYLHYIWLFIAAFASISLYGHLFWRLRLHFRSRPLAVDGDPPRSADPIRKRLERKARGMLIYPTAFIIMILPLSAYRLASLAGHDWGITAAAIAGSWYCLNGFVDVLLFGITRSIIVFPALGNDHKPSHRRTLSRFNATSSTRGDSKPIRSAFRVHVVQETIIDLEEDPTLQDQTRSSKKVRYHNKSSAKQGSPAPVSTWTPPRNLSFQETD